MFIYSALESIFHKIDAIQIFENITIIIIVFGYSYGWSTVVISISDVKDGNNIDLYFSRKDYKYRLVYNVIKITQCAVIKMVIFWF